MKFRTEISVTPFPTKIDYGSHILSLGSCFADNMAARMGRAKFDVAVNPFGTLFNPASIAMTIERIAEYRLFAESEIMQSGERCFSLDAHTSLDAPTADLAVQGLNDRVASSHKCWQSADTLIITFGTAWVYILKESGRVVANCHKLPQSRFVRRRLLVEEIVAMYEPLLASCLKDKHVILTVSPVRHVADGLEGNSVSKAVLRLAADTLAARYANVDYFPAFEILNDDLRDYRFYGDDLVHPASQAIEYVWEIFLRTALSDKARELLPKVERIVAAAAHRPFMPDSAEYAAFCQKMLLEAESLAEVDLSAECRIFAEGCNRH